MEKNENDTDAKPQTENEPDEQERKLESLSPYDIKNYIDGNKEVSLEEVWTKLNISNKYYGAKKNKTGLFNSCNLCVAEIFEHNIDEDRDAEIILRITDGWMYWRYVIFKHIQSENEEKWKAIGLVDFDFGRYREPQHFFLLSEGKNYLGIRHQTGSGTGFSEYYDAVYTIVNGNLVELVNYPSEGYSSSTGDQPITEFTANVKKLSIQSAKAYTEVSYNVDYNGSVFDPDDDFLLFRKEYIAKYTKDLVKGKYKLKIYNSGQRIRIDGKDKIGNILNTDNFTKYNFEELSEFARKKGTRENRWLKTYLSYSSNSFQKRYLLKKMKN